MKNLTKAIFALTFTAMSAAAGDFFPLKEGNQWTYRDAASGHEFKVQVSHTLYFVNHHTYYVLRGFTPVQKLVRINEYGNLVYWDEELQADFILASFEAVPGARFQAYGRECPEVGQTQEQRTTHEGPSGIWNALEIDYQVSACADAGDLAEQYTENIGMLRRVVNTLAGPRTYDLVHARVGAQAISAGSFGDFSISVLPAPQPGFWTATLRIQQRAPSRLTLHFSSGQEYDARLRDADGNVVWTWSAGRLFVQAEHSVQLNGDWRADLTIPQPSAAANAPPLYTLEAWLTNAEREPRFAATTTVEIPETGSAGGGRQLVMNARRNGQ